MITSSLDKINKLIYFKKIMYYHIILTERCNSRCKYCYEKSMKEFENGLEKKWEYDDSPVDSEVSITILNKFIKPEDTLIFYGGEPLLMLEKIKKIIDKINCRFCMQTNGKLLHLLPGKYLKKLSKILISIDGDKKRNDFNKGEGTYDLILKNINLIREKGFKGELVARMVINFPDVYEQVKHLISLTYFDSVHFQIDAGFYKNDFNEKKFLDFVKKYNNSISKLINFWILKMQEGKVLKIYPFLGIFNDLFNNTKTKLRCGAGYANFTITTKGDLSACPIMNSVKNFYCGSIDAGIKKEIYCGEPCINCEYLDLCGGRCLYSNYAKLWPREGEKLICKTIIHLISELKKTLSEIKNLISKRIVKKEDFNYEKYFGPEIIP